MTQARGLGNIGDSLNTSQVVTTGDVGTVSQTMIGAGVTGTGPAFFARAATNQNITSSTATKVTLATEIYDTNNCFVSSRFTPTVAGYYLISGGVRCSSASSDISNTQAAIYLNGAAFIRAIIQSSGVGAHTPVVTSVVYLNGTTDYVELYGLTVGTSPYFNAASSDNTSYFTGCLVRAT